MLLYLKKHSKTAKNILFLYYDNSLYIIQFSRFSQMDDIRNVRSLRPDGARVVYWMIAARRPRFNFGLQRAADWSRELGIPLLILEALRSDYPWASDRLHRFIVDGMADTAAALAGRSVTYYPYVEPDRGV